MNKIFKSFCLAIATALALVACSPDEFAGADPNGAPSIADADYSVTVDQETNIVTFTLNNAGMYPIWEIDGSPAVKTTVNGYQKYYVFKGTYTYKLKVGNRNGISDGEVEGTFTVDNTRYDFSKTIKYLTNGGSKEWRIYSAKKGHMGCGEPGSDGTGWWSASPNDKEGQGIYDDRITFSADNTYKYSAGEDGLTFCNTGITSLGVSKSEDYSTAVVGQFGTKDEAQYALGYDDATGVETITLPAKTLFPYMASEEMLNGDYTLRILSIDDKYAELVLDLSSICWHFSLINGDDPEPSTDFDPDNVNWCDVNSDLNLAAPLNSCGTMQFWWADAGWAQIADPGFSYADGVYTITANAATAAQWQGQCSIHPEQQIDLQAGQAYDFSVKVNVSEAMETATIKVCADDDQAALIYAYPVSLKRGDNLLRYAKRFPMVTQDGKEVDATATKVKFIIDLGGCPAGLVTKVSDIIIQKHNPK